MAKFNRKKGRPGSTEVDELLIRQAFEIYLRVTPDVKQVIKLFKAWHNSPLLNKAVPTTAEGIYDKIHLETDSTNPKDTMRKLVLLPTERRAFKTLLFLAALTTDRSQRDAVLGCIQERFEKECGLFGEKRARYLMIRDLVKDYGSGFKSSFGKVLRTLLKYLGFSGIVRYFLS